MSDSHYSMSARRPARSYTQIVDSSSQGEWGDGESGALYPPPARSSGLVAYDFSSSYPPQQHGRLADHAYISHPRTIMQQNDFLMPMNSSHPQMSTSHPQQMQHASQSLDMDWGRGDGLIVVAVYRGSPTVRSASSHSQPFYWDGHIAGATATYCRGIQCQNYQRY